METVLRYRGEGANMLLDFWRRKYLQEFIADGGSKIKFVTGRPGSGKTYFLNRFASMAREEGYVTVRISAREVWMHDFREVYLAALNQCDLMQCLQGCASEIIRNMGEDEQNIPQGQTFMDYLSGQGKADGINKAELRNQLKEMFLNDPLLDNNFALACSLLTGGILGHPALEPGKKEMLLGYLHDDRTIKLTQLRLLGLSPSRVTKYNARHMLRSLAQVLRLGGKRGLVICIDDLDILQDRRGNEQIHYTRTRREDAYESIRQLIDEIDSLRGIMFVYGFDRILIDNETAGLKSYQALWMRVQNEVASEHFNCFGDIANLDNLDAQEDTPQYLVNMSETFAQKDPRAQVISPEQAQAILKEAPLKGSGIPALVKEAAYSRESSQTDSQNPEEGCENV